jgi:hypothetical protein
MSPGFMANVVELLRCPGVMLYLLDTAVNTGGDMDIDT